MYESSSRPKIKNIADSSSSSLSSEINIYSTVHVVQSFLAHMYRNGATPVRLTGLMLLFTLTLWSKSKNC